MSSSAHEKIISVDYRSVIHSSSSSRSRPGLERRGGGAEIKDLTLRYQIAEMDIAKLDNAAPDQKLSKKGPFISEHRQYTVIPTDEAWPGGRKCLWA